MFSYTREEIGRQKDREDCVPPADTQYNVAPARGLSHAPGCKTTTLTATGTIPLSSRNLVDSSWTWRMRQRQNRHFKSLLLRLGLSSSNWLLDISIPVRTRETPLQNTRLRNLADGGGQRSGLTVKLCHAGKPTSKRFEGAHCAHTRLQTTPQRDLSTRAARAQQTWSTL